MEFSDGYSLFYFYYKLTANAPWCMVVVKVLYNICYTQYELSYSSITYSAMWVAGGIHQYGIQTHDESYLMTVIHG